MMKDERNGIMYEARGGVDNKHSNAARLQGDYSYRRADLVHGRVLVS